MRSEAPLGQCKDFCLLSQLGGVIVESEEIVARFDIGLESSTLAAVWGTGSWGNRQESEKSETWLGPPAGGQRYRPSVELQA